MGLFSFSSSKRRRGHGGYGGAYYRPSGFGFGSSSKRRPYHGSFSFSSSRRRRAPMMGGMFSSSYRKHRGHGGMGSMLGTLGSLGAAAGLGGIAGAAMGGKKAQQPMGQQSGFGQPVAQPVAQQPVQVSPDVVLTQPAAQQLVVCSKCGSAVPAGSKFCLECGSRMGDDSCASCGSKLPDGAKFCPNCGTPRA